MVISSTKRRDREYRTNKTKRPFDRGRAMHVTFRSEVARGQHSLASQRIRGWLRQYVPKLARYFGIRLYHFSNNGNHLHLVLMARSQAALSGFLRALSGVIPRRVLVVEKGRARGVRFWTARPYSRILGWGREFRNVLLYVQRNVLESSGMLRYQPRDLNLQQRERIFIERTFLLGKPSRQVSFDFQPSLF